MKYMLDTNICIYLIKKRPENVIDKFQSLKLGDVCFSSITLSELFYGVEKSQRKQKNTSALEKFILPLDILPFDDKAAYQYGALRAYLERKGTPIGSMDLMIAAHALSIRAILVTNNVKEFSRVPKLTLENWAQ
ncbi:MAG: twitching motility protein PilT [Gammaproteobacteria bacterium RIFCSPHIGHO2_02_FULL_42_13]|nr:MAG: twitching motility protein PilT [Gammaproteobacteria bacterium RIFCSPHIGHO2_02_FULL_42_13]OGT69742.1 MAG: twitching motility protein PilT [Gammaproteobacteria bacterium RIFCSPLOWO2_02_FULL_42_9]HLB58092.1 type II toxin-antitoxin system VapC family toxin [Gammaproteobacteria bacterium]